MANLALYPYFLFTCLLYQNTVIIAHSESCQGPIVYTTVELSWVCYSADVGAECLRCVY